MPAPQARAGLDAGPVSGAAWRLHRATPRGVAATGGAPHVATALRHVAACAARAAALPGCPQAALPPLRQAQSAASEAASLLAGVRNGPAREDHPASDVAAAAMAAAGSGPELRVIQDIAAALTPLARWADGVADGQGCPSRAVPLLRETARKAREARDALDKALVRRAAVPPVQAPEPGLPAFPDHAQPPAARLSRHETAYQAPQAQAGRR
jgi:hypothetical protein